MYTPDTINLKKKQKKEILPNVRRLFIPDPGYLLLDVDLSGADAQVVAWEANDESLKTLFRSGAKIHIHNFETLFKRKFDSDKDKRIKPPGWNYPPYDSLKRFVHATNYGASARTVAITLGWTIASCENYRIGWFAAHPGIREWQKRTDFQLQTTRLIRNKFGYRIVYFDRPDGLLPEALAWIPQSTVGVLASRGGVRIHKTLPWVEPLIQVHDSLVLQIPFARHNPSSLEQIQDLLHLPIPYDDPLIIPWSISGSTKSWADCKPMEWTRKIAA